MTETQPTSPPKAPDAPGGPRRLDLHFVGALWRIVLAGAAVAGAGAYPTSRLSGQAGLRAELCAAVIVLAVMAASAAVVVRVSRSSLQTAAMVFATGGMVRVLVCAALAGGAWAIFALPVFPLCIWIFILFVVMSLAELDWFLRALRGLAGPKKSPPPGGSDDSPRAGQS